ncbi:MAG: SDR family oxidoreductase [Candidatus Hodarchaeales archaeon]|jgi:3-oxoacyl-[acyl-carrier protein] reductase
MRMENETAIITGSTSGIGKKLAELFLEEGCKVVICSRNEERVKETVSEFKEKYKDAVIGFSCDVSDIDSIKNVVEKTMAKFGSIRILVSNAGVNSTYGPLRYFSQSQVASDTHSILGTNLTGTINAVTTVLPYMISQKYGRIITLSGGGGDRPLPHMTLYSASKGGVVAFSKCLAEEFKESREDIKINIFQPGMITTNLAKNSKPAEGWKEEEEFRRDNILAHEYLGTNIDESCPKVIPYVLPTCKANGKSFRGFSLIKMIRGGRKLQKNLKKGRKTSPET